MGDRTGLPRLDRTNGYDDGRGYMRAKKSKLAQQNEEIRDALRQRHSAMRTELFKGISINVNGRTQPTADELKRLILLNGGEYHPYYRYQQTKFMIATNLSTARIKTLRPDDRIVKPEWITDSVKANCILPYQDYQLFAEEPRGKNSTSVLALESDSSNQASNHSLFNNSNNNNNNSNNINQTSIKQLLQANAAKKSDTSQPSSSSLTIASESTNELRSSTRSTRTSTAAARITTNATTSVVTNKGSSNNKSAKNSKKQSTMNDFVVRGISRPTQRFPTPKVRQDQRQVANIIGRTGIDEIINLINEWVGCSEGIVDEDVACVTKYFYDLMGEKNYHNKFCEVFDAFKQRILVQNEKCWTDLYNDLARTFKNELSSNVEASQNLCQLITYIDHSKVSDCEQHKRFKPLTSTDESSQDLTNGNQASDKSNQRRANGSNPSATSEEEEIDID